MWSCWTRVPWWATWSRTARCTRFWLSVADLFEGFGELSVGDLLAGVGADHSDFFEVEFIEASGVLQLDAVYHEWARLGESIKRLGS
jgi:hypothetical protein